MGRGSITTTPRTRRMAQLAVSVVLVGVIVWFVLRQFADLSEVTAVIRDLTPARPRCWCWRRSGTC